jgi:hypothetical protein
MAALLNSSATLLAAIKLIKEGKAGTGTREGPNVFVPHSRNQPISHLKR